MNRAWRQFGLSDGASATAGLGTNYLDPNRALLRDRLEHAIAVADRDPRSLAVRFIDVDDFKSANDTFGRWGGDEFPVIAERLDATSIGSFELSASVSVGAAQLDSHPTAAELVQAADAALQVGRQRSAHRAEVPS